LDNTVRETDSIDASTGKFLEHWTSCTILGYGLALNTSCLEVEAVYNLELSADPGSFVSRLLQAPMPNNLAVETTATNVQSALSG
jgi:hypothetical protein